MSKRQREQEKDRLFTRRALLLGAAQLGLIGTLAGRLYFLQVMEGERYTMLADDNRISLRLLPPPRGRILDRNGEPLAVNRLNYRVTLVAEQVRNVEATLDAIGKLIELTELDRRRVMRDLRRRRGFVPVTVREDLTWEDVARIEVNIPDLPGVAIEVGALRHYPHTESVGHILGYVGPVAEADLTGEPLLELPDFRIGKNGIERIYDRELRGAAGTVQVEVNALGRVVRELARDEPTAGQDVVLTIDIGLQSFCRGRLGDESGSIVVLDVHTGDVLSLVSAPAYDPNLFSAGLSARDWEELLANPKGPLTNKAIAGMYAPGSTFKMVTALAALEAGVVRPSDRISCPGYLELGDHRFHCWKKEGHGGVNLQEAMMVSCDVYFYEVARRTGMDRLAAMARRLGFGDLINIDLPGERRGLMPTREWKQRTRGQPWVQGETLIAGIGQGYVLSTPLQLAVMTARLVNGGVAVIPHMTRSIGGKPNAGRNPPPYPSMGLQRSGLEAMIRAMNAVTLEERGTAYRARITERGFEMGGKTGTAQVRRITMQERERGVRRNEDLPWRFRDHALFVGYAPVHAPRYACACVVEHGGGGSAVAAPIVRDVLTETQRRDPSRRTGPVASLVTPNGG
ncbi:MAG: penicillin-binding protein 2 [Alphaproteobacteria bacterium]|nr:penicillin-binding protein 2 [Alphaproteobacteria bacterium]